MQTALLVADDDRAATGVEIATMRAKNVAFSRDSRCWRSIMCGTYTNYEDSRVREPLRQLAYGRDQRRLISGELPWDQANDGYRDNLVRRIESAGLRFERNGATARISTVYPPPTEILLKLLEERQLLDPYQVVLEFLEDKMIGLVRVHRVALFGTTHRRFGGGRVKVLKSAYAVPQENGGHLFVGTLSRARQLIEEMRIEKARLADLKAEKEEAARLAKEKAEAARVRRQDMLAIRSAFE